MARQGFKAKIWIRDGGVTGGSAEWLALGIARDCVLNTTMGEGDATHRAGGGFTMSVAMLEDASVDAEILWTDDDAAQLVLEEAYRTRGVVGVRMLDREDDVTGEGLEANCQVLNFTRVEPLNDTIKANLTLKPTYSTVAPRWVEGLGEAAAAPSASASQSGSNVPWDDASNALTEGSGVASVEVDDGASNALRITFAAEETDRSLVFIRVKARVSVLAGSPTLSILSNITEEDVTFNLDATLQWYEAQIAPSDGWQAIVAAGTAYADITALSPSVLNLIELDTAQLRFA